MEATKGKYIAVDEFQQTSAAGVYALGDVCGKVELTPVAIAAGRRLADRLNYHISSATHFASNNVFLWTSAYSFDLKHLHCTSRLKNNIQ